LNEKEQLLGERVKLLRETLSLTQKDLGEKIGVTNQTIYNIEAGRTKKLSKRQLERLTFQLGCTDDYLYGKSDERLKYSNGRIKVVSLDPDFILRDRLENAIKEFQEAFQLLCSINEKLSKRDKEIIIKILKSFVEDENE
jgi:transcriptional regulator with XRE-family HTH domain